MRIVDRMMHAALLLVAIMLASGGGLCASQDGLVRAPCAPITPRTLPTELKPQFDDPAFLAARRRAVDRLKKAGAKILWDEATVGGKPQQLVSSVEFDAVYAEGTIIDPVHAPQDVDNRLLRETLPYLPELPQLILGMTKVDDAGLRFVPQLRHLTSLRVVSNDAKRFPIFLTDEGMDTIAGIPSISSLTVFGARISDRGVEKLARATTLEHVNLLNCPVTSQCLEPLSRLPRLDSLWLGRAYGFNIPESYHPDFGKPITDSTRRALKRFNGRLTELELIGVDIHPSLLDAIGEIKSLWSLDLEDSRVTPEDLMRLKARLKGTRIEHGTSSAKEIVEEEEMEANRPEKELPKTKEEH
jgi:hypothetical protein